MQEIDKIESHSKRRKRLTEWMDGLDGRSKTTLLIAGCKNKDDVISALEDGRLISVDGCGDRTIELIKKWAGSTDVAKTSKKNMKRTNFYYPQPMLDALKERSDETGIPVSELIRTAVAEFLSKK